MKKSIKKKASEDGKTVERRNGGKRIPEIGASNERERER